MKLIKYLLIIFFLFNKIIYSQTGWYSLNSGTTFDLYEVQFLDVNTGYISGLRFSPTGGIVRKTTNGGTSWTTQLSISNKLYGLYFINSITGTIVGDLGIIIKKTTDGGLSWSTQFASGNPTLFSVRFLNSNIGGIVGAIGNGANGTIFYTSDGGITWLDRSYGQDNLYEDIIFFNPNTGYVVGIGNTSEIIKTTNSGVNWLNIYSPGALYGISSLDQNNMVCSGWFQIILKTTDSGSTWITLHQTNSSSHLNSIHYFDLNNIVSVGDSGLILRTINGGNNWIQQTSNINTSLQKVFFIDSQNGWICGDFGVLLKTTTGGFTDISPISNEIPNSFVLYQNYPNPFNPKTIIRFQIPRNSFTNLTIYNLLGQQISTLVDEVLKPGTYEINWVVDNNPSGVYYYKLVTEDFTETKKMILIK